jgi:hypothetical protein
VEIKEMKIFHRYGDEKISSSLKIIHIASAFSILAFSSVTLSAMAQGASSASEAAIGASSPISTSTISFWQTVISAGGVLFAAFLAFVIGQRNSDNTVKLAREAAVNELNADLRRRNSELAFSISSAIDGNPGLARRFAVGIVKVVDDNTSEKKNIGKILFIPFNSRVTVGRDSRNDLVLLDDKLHISRWHCGLVSDGDAVYVEDFSAINETELNNSLLGRGGKLKDGDHINIAGQCVLKFQGVRRHEHLSMAGATVPGTGST